MLRFWRVLPRNSSSRVGHVADDLEEALCGDNKVSTQFYFKRIFKFFED